MAFIAKTFGVNALRRDQLITRGPRFQIAFDANAAELVKQSASNTRADEGSAYRQGQRQISMFGDNNAFGNGNVSGNASSGGYGLNAPSAAGRYELQRCKVDSVSLGIMPGRRVAAVRWEGVAEGITYIPTSLQAFKNQVNLVGNTNVARNATLNTGAPSNIVPNVSTNSNTQ